MTIRLKLMWSYGLMLTALIAVGVAAVWSTSQWQKAANELGQMHRYGVQAERLRLGMNRQINYGLDFLSGQAFDPKEYEQILSQSSERFLELKEHRLSPDEADHIEGLEETITEIEFRLERIFSLNSNSAELNAATERPRLREIADEVTSDIAVLNQYYRAQVDLSLKAAAHAGDIATIVIGISVFLVLLQLVVLVLLTQRWLVRPIAMIHRVTEAISQGNLNARVSINTSDEWAELSASVNHMAKSLKRYQERLATRERFSALGEAAAYTAHNIRNPLAGIRAAVQVLQQSGKQISSEDKASLSEIVTTIDRLSLWVRRFLDFAKPLDLQKEMTDINEVMRHALMMSRKNRNAESVHIQMNLDTNLPKVYVDSILIEQSLSAIITNALQSGGDKVKISSEAVTGDDGDMFTELRVSDNGDGISLQMQKRLFNEFATSKSDGTGLGLAQAKKVVSLHGGEIFVASDERSGTEVSIRIPMGKPQSENVTNRETRNKE